MADEGLIIKITADAKEFLSGADKAVKDAKSKFKGLGDEISKELKRVDTVGTTALKGITGVLGGMTAAATAAVGSLTKSAIDAYADYQQLEGGVETLFKESAGIVKDYAMQAYKNAGISANKYMESVTGFSASLLQSLGGDTEKAAEYANRALMDMSDNANKMGTDMSSIQTAYQGFAKQNYTMLDNLKLGYGGTKEEMARLIEDASKMTDVQKNLGITVDANSMSFGNIVNAISVMQEQMGIAGTTAEEAEKTISGSLGMVKASWADLMTSIAGDGKGMKQAVADLVSSVEIYAKNILPRVEETLYGISDVITGLAPVIIEALPRLINKVGPGIAQAGIAIANSLGNAFVSALGSIDIGKTNVFLVKVWQVGSEIINNITKGILDNIVSIRNVAGQIITYFQFGIEAILPNLLEIAKEMVYTFAQGFLTYKYLVMEIGIKMITAISEGLAEALPDLLDEFIPMLLNLIDMLAENLPKFIDSLISMISTIADSIMDWLPEILGSIGNLVYTLCNKILDNLPQILDGAVKIVAAILAMIADILVAALISIGQHLVKWWDSSVKPWFDRIGDNIANWWEGVKTSAKTKLENIKTIVKGIVETIKTDVKSKVDEIKTGLSEKVENIKTTVSDKVTAIKTKVTETVGNLKTSISEKINAIKTNITTKITEIKTNVSTKVGEIFDKVVDTIGKLPEKMLSIGKNIVEGIWDGISGAKDWISQKISGFVDGLVGGVKNLLGISSPSKVFAQIGEYMTEGLVVGMEGETDDLKNTAEKQIDQLKSMYNGLSFGMPQINAGKLNALRMAQTMHTVTNENGNVFNFYQTFEGAGADAGEAMFRQFQRKVRYAGGVL